MPLMPLLRSVGRALAAPFRRTSAGVVLGSDPPPRVLRAPALPFAPQSDPRLMAWARGVVEKVRTAAAAGHLRFLPHLDFYTGETPEIREQYRQMLREPTLKAAVGTKVLSVAQLDPQAHPEDPDDPRQREAGDFVLYAIRKLKGGPRALAWSVLVHGLLDGWSVCEKVWHREPVRGGRFTGKRIYRTVKAKDSRTLTPVVDEFKNVEGIRAGLYNAGRVFSPDDFVTWSHMPLFESPVGTSDFRAPYRAYWIKNTTWQLRGLHLEKWTGPFLRGEYGHADQKATLEAALEEARAHTWITVPTGTLVEALEISTKGTADFEAALRDCDREMLIGTVGASLQILEGQVTDARGDTGEHRATSELFQWMLAAALGDVVTECMAPELVEVNYAGVESPAITWGSVSERDMQARLATDKGLQEIGLRLSRKEAYRHYSRAEPADEADVLRPGGKDDQADNGAPGPGGPASPFDGPPDAGAAFSEDHWHEAGVLCYAEGSAAHKVGDVWKGPSGRWFTRRQDGRVVPAKNPQAEKPAAKKAPVKAAAPAGKASLDDIHGEVQAARKGGLTLEKVGELGKRIAEHLTCDQIAELKKRLGEGFAGKGGVGTGPKQALADRIAARAAELAAASPKAEPKPVAAPAAPPKPAEPQTIGPSATVPREQWVASFPNDAEGVKELVGGLDHDVKIIRRKDGRVTVEARPKVHLRGRMDVKAAIETGPDLQHAAARAYESLYGSHRAAVQAALTAGKPVPPEVMADYPDLAKGKAASTGPKPPSPGFTGIDANGHEWRNGVQVARQEEPGKGREPAEAVVLPPNKAWTKKAGQDVVDRLAAATGMDLKIVGSVAIKGKSAHDVDVMVDGGFDQEKADKALESMGFERRGQSLLSPQEARNQKKDFTQDVWSELHHYRHKKSGHDLELWRTLPPAAPAAPQSQPAAPAKALGDPRSLTPAQLATGKFSAAKGIDAGIHEKAVGKVTVDGQAYFWKGTGKDNAENNTLTAELCAAAGVATPACRLANVPGAPNEFPGEGGLLTEWVEAPTYAKLSLTPGGDKLPIAGLLRPGEAQKAALLSYLLGMKDRHGGNYLVKDKRLVSIDHDGALWDGGAEAESFDTGGEADTAMDALASEPFLREITEGATPGKPVDRRAARFDPAIVREMAGHAGRLSTKLAEAGRQRSAEVVTKLSGVLKELASGDATWGRLEALTRTALPE